MIGRSDGHGGGGGDVGGGCGHTRTDTVYVGVYSLGREQCCAVPGPAAPSCGHLDAPPGALTPDSLHPGGESGPHRTCGLVVCQQQVSSPAIGSNVEAVWPLWVHCWPRQVIVDGHV